MAAVRKLLLPIGLLLGAAAFALLYYRVDPTQAAWMPRCPFHLLTGLQCPACGNQRALHALLNGHLADAFAFNPFFLLSLPYLAALVVAAVLRRRHPGPYRRLAHPRVVMAYVVLICLWWVLRNII